MPEEKNTADQSTQPTADWRWELQKKQLEEKDSSQNPLETADSTKEEINIDDSQQVIPPYKEQIDQKPQELVVSSEDNVVYGEPNLNRYSQATAGSSEKEAVSIKPISLSQFIVLMNLAAFADLLDLLDVVFEGATSGAWAIISLILDIIIGLVFYLYTHIVCDKYTRQILQKATGMATSNTKEKMLTLAKNIKYLASGVKLGQAGLQIGDGIPIIEIIPFSVIGVVVVYVFSQIIAKKVKELEEAETEEQAEKAEKDIERAERAMETSTRLLAIAKSNQGQPRMLNRAPSTD